MMFLDFTNLTKNKHNNGKIKYEKLIQREGKIMKQEFSRQPRGKGDAGM